MMAPRERRDLSGRKVHHHFPEAGGTETGPSLATCHSASSSYAPGFEKRTHRAVETLTRVTSQPAPPAPVSIARAVEPVSPSGVLPKFRRSPCIGGAASTRRVFRCGGLTLGSGIQSSRPKPGCKNVTSEEVSEIASDVKSVLPIHYYRYILARLTRRQQSGESRAGSGLPWGQMYCTLCEPGGLTKT